MKQLFYVCAVLMFSTSMTFASTGEKVTEEKVAKKNLVKIEKVSETSVDGVLFTTYRGRCLDGRTFLLEADSLEQAQDFVNTFCRATNDMQ
ncbi:hypothetical protein [Dokdonia sp. R86516]|uniref:hypothetical protein n=1 Tax=Dokdonia sp. R86516 TaxID=3093856 RepID=UPI0037C5A2AB